MFRNFIFNLRSSLQPENYISQQNNTNIGHTSHLTDHTATSRDTMHNNNTAFDSNNESSMKSVEEQESKHYDSIISSDGEDEITKELVNDIIAEPVIDQLNSLMENSTCSDLDQLFQNTDSTEKTINSAHRENLEPVAISISNESKTNVNEETLESNLREKVMENQDMTKNIDSVLESHTDSAINSIDTDEMLDEIIDKNESSEVLNLHLKEPDNSEVQNMDENTKKCLKEFNEVLNEVQNKDVVLFENAKDSIGEFDDIVLVEDLNLDNIDPLSLVDVQMCEDDNTIIISDDDEQNVLDVSPTKRITTDNSKDNVNTCIPTTENYKNAESYNIENVKETCSKSDTIIGSGNNNAPSVLTVDSQGNMETISTKSEELDKMSTKTLDTPTNKEENMETISTKSKELEKMSTKTLNTQTNKEENMETISTKSEELEKMSTKTLNTPTNKEENMETISTKSEELEKMSTKTLNTQTNKEENMETISTKSDKLEKMSTKTLNTPTNKQENMETISTKLDELEKMSTKTLNTQTNEEENIKTISTKSDELEKMSTKSVDNDDCGYLSSDFEFITEEEAKKEELINKNNYKDEKKYKRETRQKHFYATRNRVQNDPYGPGPSNRNIVNEEENYIVPEENEVINMFQALPPMPLSEINFLENKSIRCRVPMLVQYEGVGFDMSLAMHDDRRTGQEYHQEAQETKEKILGMYQENSYLKQMKLQKRRRRM